MGGPDGISPPSVLHLGEPLHNFPVLGAAELPHRATAPGRPLQSQCRLTLITRCLSPPLSRGRERDPSAPTQQVTGQAEMTTPVP